MARRLPRSLPLSITFLLARASAEIIGPHLLDGTDAPTLHRDIAQSVVSIDDLLTPFAGKKPGLAFRVHADNDAKTTDGGVADAILAALRETGLPADPAEAVAVLTKSPVPLSTAVRINPRGRVAGWRQESCGGVRRDERARRSRGRTAAPRLPLDGGRRRAPVALGPRRHPRRPARGGQDVDLRRR